VSRDDIIRMAREAANGNQEFLLIVEQLLKYFPNEFESFAALVAAAERERLRWDGLHSCHPECDRPGCVNTRKAVEAEREECAKVAEERWLNKANCTAEQMYEMLKKSIAEAIRARGRA
jgi:hypothetical protein